jgi:hypothetical protein
MAFTFPLALSDFWSGLPVASFSWDLGESLVSSKTAAGEILVADKGTRLWSGSAILRPQTNEDASATLALLNVLRQSNRTFLATPRHHAAPTYDPDGVILGASSVTINSLSSDLRSLSLAGLPAAYILSAGDFLGFQYLSSPTRYALHQIVSGPVIADGTGTTAEFEVTPTIRTGAATGAAVTLVNPVFMARLIPGSAQMGVVSARVTGSYESRSGISRGAMFSSLDFTQTLR